MKAPIHHSPFTIHDINIEQEQEMLKEERNAPYSPFTTHYSPFTIHHSRFTIHDINIEQEQEMLKEERNAPYSPLTTHYSPFTK